MKSDPQVLSFNIAQHVHNIYVWSLQASFGLLNAVRTTYLHSFAKVIIPYLLTKLEDRQNSRPVILEEVKICSMYVSLNANLYVQFSVDYEFGLFACNHLNF